MAELKLHKCKLCGEPLDITKAVGGAVQCGYCGTMYTLPKETADDRLLNFLDSGELSLDKGDFEGAMTSYAKAAEIDGNEPEAHFGKALSKFKVRYIKDEVANRLQPICYEVTDKKFSDDPDYMRAYMKATPEQRAVYEEKAKDIDYIQSEFYNLKQSGLDYDCFICVKVTDDNTKLRTADYKYADDIYFALKKKYKPFFSERELTNVTGADYEARILYALYSSECMLVVCGDEEYLQTKWVKNEYSRFLKLVNDSEKEKDSIAIAFTGKPIEKLPGRDGKLQGIDLGKLGALSRVEEFVESHTPAARAKRAAEAEEKKRAEEEQKAKLKELEERIDNYLQGGAKGNELSEGVQPEREDIAHTEKERENSEEESISREKREREDAEKRRQEEEKFKALGFEISGNELKKYTGKGGDVKIPVGVTAIGDNAFKGCKNLTGVVIPEGVTAIGEWAFYDCESLTNVVIPNSVITIGEKAFYGCESLTNVVIPNSVTAIGNEAFSGCASLTDITIPESVNSIGDYAFYGCKSLKDITIFIGVTSIGMGAFANCESLTDITIPESVISIGDYAFNSCKSLKISVNENNVNYSSLDGILFDKDKRKLVRMPCAATEISLPKSVVSIGAGAFEGSNLESITISESIKTIGEQAFLWCSKLTSVTIPSSVTSIAGDAFYGCRGLINISVDKDNKNYSSSDGMLFDKYKQKVIAVSKDKVKISLPDSVTYIGEYAFSNCRSLKKIIIPKSVKSVGKHAFSCCGNLKSITIPNGVKSIDGAAFGGCENLKSIKLPDSVTYIGGFAFYGCTNLKIYCRTAERPKDWETDWNVVEDYPSKKKATVVWGYRGI